MANQRAVGIKDLAFIIFGPGIMGSVRDVIFQSCPHNYSALANGDSGCDGKRTIRSNPYRKCLACRHYQPMESEIGAQRG